MSRLYYFASDDVLADQHNPHVKKLSVNQALEMGLDINLEYFDDDLDKNQSGVILFCATEAELGYPNIFSINKEKFYNDIGTVKKFCTGLEWNYSDNTVEVILKYIQKHLETASEIEVWSVWLGNEESSISIKKNLCKLSELTVDRLIEFYNDESDFQCLTVINSTGGNTE